MRKIVGLTTPMRMMFALVGRLLDCDVGVASAQVREEW
jgi:hypothetical protein